MAATVLEGTITCQISTGSSLLWITSFQTRRGSDKERGTNTYSERRALARNASSATAARGDGFDCRSGGGGGGDGWVGCGDEFGDGRRDDVGEDAGAAGAAHWIEAADTRASAVLALTARPAVSRRASAVAGVRATVAKQAKTVSMLFRDVPKSVMVRLMLTRIASLDK